MVAPSFLGAHFLPLTNRLLVLSLFLHWHFFFGYHIPNPCWWEITALILYSELRRVIAMSSGQWPIQTLLGWVLSSIHSSSFSSIHSRKWNNSFSQVPPKGTFCSYLIPKEHKHTVEITEEREESFYHRCFFKILI